MIGKIPTVRRLWPLVFHHSCVYVGEKAMGEGGKRNTDLADLWQKCGQRERERDEIIAERQALPNDVCFASLRPAPWRN